MAKKKTKRKGSSRRSPNPAEVVPSNVRVEIAIDTREPGGSLNLEHMSGKEQLLVMGRTLAWLRMREGFDVAARTFRRPTDRRLPNPLDLRLDPFGRLLPIDPQSDVAPTAQVIRWAIWMINLGRQQRSVSLLPVGPVGDWGTTCTRVGTPPVHHDMICQRLGIDGMNFEVHIPGGQFSGETVPDVVVKPKLLIHYETPSYEGWPEFERLTPHGMGF